MKRLIYIFVMIILCWTVIGAVNWVDDPADCPSSDATNFPGQDCSPNEICGDNGGIAQCYDTDSLVWNNDSTTDPSIISYSGSFDGGALVDCYRTADAGSPFCDNSGNFWCDRAAACYTTQHRYTNCTDFGEYLCSECRSGYLDCDSGGDDCEIRTGVTSCVSPDTWHNHHTDCSTCACDSGWDDCNGQGINASDGCEYQDNLACASNALNLTGCAGCTCNSGYSDCDSDLSDGLSGTGCEVQDFVTACSIGAVSGTYDDGCTCLVDPQHHLTNQSADGSSTHANLWTRQYGTGAIANFTDGDSNRSVWLNHTPCFIWEDGLYICPGGSNFLANGTGASTDTWNSTEDIWNVVNNGTFTTQDEFGNSSIIRVHNESWATGICSIFNETNYADSNFLRNKTNINVQRANTTSVNSTVYHTELIKMEANVINFSTNAGLRIVSNVGSNDAFQVEDPNSIPIIDVDTTNMIFSVREQIRIVNYGTGTIRSRWLNDNNNTLMRSDKNFTFRIDEAESKFNWQQASNNLMHLDGKGNLNVSENVTANCFGNASGCYTVSEFLVDSADVTVTGENITEVDRLIYAPDYVNDQIPLAHIDDSLFPFGVKLIHLEITLPSNAAYSMVFEEWNGTPPAALNDIETLTTGAGEAFKEANSTDIDDSDIAKNSYVFLDIPATDVDWIFVKVVYYAKTS